MDISSTLIIAVSIILSGYFIGNGICKGLIFFKSNQSQHCLDNVVDTIFGEDNIFEEKLVNKKYIIKKLGIKNKDFEYLTEKYPGLNPIDINNKLYYERKSADEWIDTIK